MKAYTDFAILYAANPGDDFVTMFLEAFIFVGERVKLVRWEEFLLRGCCLFTNAEFSKAISYLDIVIKMIPNSSWTYYTKGLALKKLGKNYDAIVEIKKAIAIVPDSVYVEGLADNYDLEGDNIDAIALYKEAIEKSPKNPRLVYNFGVLYYGLFDRYRSLDYLRIAIDLIDKALKILPTYDDASHNLFLYKKVLDEALRFGSNLN